MKKLITFLSLIISIPFFALDTQISTSQGSKIQPFDFSKFIKLDWTGDEDFLYLNMTCHPHLIFPEKYRSTVYENGCSCHIQTNIADQSSLTYNDQKVISYELTVHLINNTNNKMVSHRTIHTIQTHENTNGVNKTHTYTITLSNNITNPSLDLTFKPQFSRAIENNLLGRMIFKNSFPFSQL